MRTKSIKGYPVVNLADGVLLGKIQDIIINPAAKKVEGLVVGEKGFLKGKLRYIPYEQIYNIGRDVLIIKSEEPPPAGTRAPFEEFKDYSFLGSSVVSSQGDYIAKVQDFTFDMPTGAIQELLLYDTPERDKKDKNIYLSMEGVLNLGKDYIIASPDYISFLREEEQAGRAEQKEEEGPAGEKRGEQGDLEKREGTAERFAEPEGAPAGEESGEGQRLQDKFPSLHHIFQNIKDIWGYLEKEISSEGKELARESKEKMKKFVINKKANYTVKGNDGQPLVETGMEITEEILQQADDQNKIFNLFLAVISRELEENLQLFGDKIRNTFR